MIRELRTLCCRKTYIITGIRKNPSFADAGWYAEKIQSYPIRLHVQDIFTALGFVSRLYSNEQHTCSQEITTHIKKSYQRKHTKQICRNFSTITESIPAQRLTPIHTLREPLYRYVTTDDRVRFLVTTRLVKRVMYARVGLFSIQKSTRSCSANTITIS